MRGRGGVARVAHAGAHGDAEGLGLRSEAEPTGGAGRERGSEERGREARGAREAQQPEVGVCVVGVRTDGVRGRGEQGPVGGRGGEGVHVRAG